MKKILLLLFSLILSSLGMVSLAGSFKVKCAHPEAIVVKWTLKGQTWELPADGTPLLLDNVESGSPRQVMVKDGYNYIISEVKETVDSNPDYSDNPWASKVSDTEWTLYPGWEIELTYEIVLEETSNLYDGTLHLTVDDPTKVNLRFNSDRTISNLQPGEETVIKFNSVKENMLYATPVDYETPLYSATKNGEDVSFDNSKGVAIADGDKIIIKANYPEESVKVSFDYAEGAQGFITKVTSNGEEVSFADGFEALLGSKIALYIDTENYEFKSVTVNGKALNYYGYEEYLSFVLTKESTVAVNAKPYETINFTINVDNATKVEVYKNEYYYGKKIELKNGENEVKISSKDEFISICEPYGVEYDLFSIKDESGKEYSKHPEEWLTRITPTEGMALTILTQKPEAQEENAKVTFTYSEGAEGFITDVEVGYSDIEDFNEGFEAKIGSEIRLYFNTEDYEDDWLVLVNGEEIETSWTGTSGTFTLEKDTEVKVTATKIGDEEQPSEINFIVNVDNAKNVKAYINSSMFGEEIDLVDNENKLVFGEDDEDIVFVAAEGASIVSIKDETGKEYYDADDMSTMITPTEGMVLTVVTKDISTSINSVMNDSKSVDLYGLNGMCILKNASAEQLKSLQPGIYLVNNRKLLVK